ncbi:AbrB/MazE/SpoVT family DNA-binding domain-containing protein [Salicibibacter kimchii]|uniref:AbrB/MazE/SpoVT family DNA-binding domain-containing protein n=1 Tax=Salicibibacter kimchii TaxID=2099786 RepID=UPI001D04FB51
MTSKGQVTIPKAIREQLKLQEGDKLAFIEENGKILLTKSSTIALRQFFDSVNREAEKQG